MQKIESIKGNSVYRIMPIIMRQIVFTKKEVVEESGVSVNAVSNIINQLVELGIIVPDSSVVKKGFRYQSIYEVFVGKKSICNSVIILVNRLPLRKVAMQLVI